jgi:hypothetical protein
MYIEELLTSRLSTYLGFQVSERILLKFCICWSALDVVGGNMFSYISVDCNSYFNEIQIQIISLMKATQCHKSGYSYETYSRSAKQNNLLHFFFSFPFFLFLWKWKFNFFVRKIQSLGCILKHFSPIHIFTHIFP